MKKNVFNVLMILAILGSFTMAFTGCQQAMVDSAQAANGQPAIEKALPYLITCSIEDFPMPVSITREFYVPNTPGYVYTWTLSPGLKSVYGGTVILPDGNLYQYISITAIAAGHQYIYSLAKGTVDGVVDELLTYKAFDTENIIYTTNPKQIVIGYGQEFSAIYDSAFGDGWFGGTGISVVYGGITGNRSWGAVVGTQLGNRTFSYRRTFKANGKTEYFYITVAVVKFGPIPNICTSWTPPQYTGTTKTYKLCEAIKGASSYEWTLVRGSGIDAGSFGYLTPNGLSCDLTIYTTPYFPDPNDRVVNIKVRGIASDGTASAWASYQVPYTGATYN